MQAKKKILILGVGNILMKDDGAGVYVAQKMMNMDLPSDVEVIDGGVKGLDLLYYIEGRKKVIVVDAITLDDVPGSIYRFTDKDLAEKKQFLRTAHGIDFYDVVKMAEQFSKNKPEEIVFIGIVPEDISEGLELTPVIEKKVARLIELVMKETEGDSGQN